MKDVYLHYKQTLLEFNKEALNSTEPFSTNYHHIDYYHDQCSYEQSKKELLCRHIHLAFHLLEYWYHRQTAVGVTDKDIHDIYAELHAICNCTSKYIITAGGKQYLKSRQITSCKAIKNQLPVLSIIMQMTGLGKPDMSSVNIQKFANMKQIMGCSTAFSYCAWMMELDGADDFWGVVIKSVYDNNCTQEMLETVMGQLHYKYHNHLEYIMQKCVDCQAVVNHRYKYESEQKEKRAEQKAKRAEYDKQKYLKNKDKIKLKYQTPEYKAKKSAYDKQRYLEKRALKRWMQKQEQK